MKHLRILVPALLFTLVIVTGCQRGPSGDGEPQANGGVFNGNDDSRDEETRGEEDDDPRRDTPDNDDPTETPMETPMETPGDPDIVETPTEVVDCTFCEGCGRGMFECETRCESILQGMDADAKAAWLSCAADGGFCNPETASACQEDPTWTPEEPIEDPIEPMDCSVCDVCGADAEACAARCVAIQDALEPEFAGDWWACVAEDPCQSDRPWTCFDGLGCLDETIVASHCDTLARCTSDGRGWLNEEACREEPYHEPKQWSCLKAERREAVVECLSGMVCDDVRPCIDNAACAGDPMCREMMSTRLVVDCQRVCRDNYAACGDDMTTCLGYCDEAAFRLDDAHRRTVEDCALLNPAECDFSSTSVITTCFDTLTCDQALVPMDGFASRCGDMDEPVFARSGEWACLGQVLRTGINDCLENAPCDEAAACLEQATCGGDEGCLDFMGSN